MHGRSSFLPSNDTTKILVPSNYNLQKKKGERNPANFFVANIDPINSPPLLQKNTRVFFLFKIDNFFYFFWEIILYKFNDLKIEKKVQGKN